MINSQDIKIGTCVRMDGKLYYCIDFLHVKPGKGNTIMRIKLKNLVDGRVLERRFDIGEKLEDVRIERRPYQFLYKDDTGFHFMHNETFEQVDIDADMIENADLMKDGQYVEMMFVADDDHALTCELPPFVELKVTYTEPAVKGNTASTSAMKAATLETGAEIMVPLFINQDEVIKVDTRTRSYAERVK